MQYRNKRTGAIVEIPGIVTGDVWEKVDVAPKKVPAPEMVEPKIEEKPKKAKKTDIKPKNAPKKTRGKKK